ncbi:hypothetical protein WMF31_36305 [Sorangium sp. So ce1036]|uniref:hypothetical protein n=1 Tax=Sorangium sp. So ce1036 TaxID=3133328 RepID=UPI003F0AAA4B
MRGRGADDGAARRPTWSAVCAMGVLAALAAGCASSRCDRSAEANPLTLYTEGTSVGGEYMSSAWDGDDDGDGEVGPEEGLLYFPGGMRYDIRHGLGRVPRSWQIYLSFERDGTRSGTLAHAAGNQAEVPCIDEESLIVVNGSCSEYWLLVVASAGDDSGDDDADAPRPEEAAPGKCRDEQASP